MVFELLSGHDFVTKTQFCDRRPGQKQYVSQPYGGRHRYKGGFWTERHWKLINVYLIPKIWRLGLMSLQTIFSHIIMMCRYFIVVSLKYRNVPKFSDGYNWTVYTQIRLLEDIHSMVKPPCSNLRVITAIFSGVRMFRKFTISSPSHQTVYSTQPVILATKWGGDS